MIRGRVRCRVILFVIMSAKLISTPERTDDPEVTTIPGLGRPVSDSS